MRLSADLELLKFDLKKYKAQLHRHFEEEIVELAKVFLNAATANIPVWSGASLSTFKPLADKANFSLVISPVPRARNSSPTPTNVGEITADKKRFVYSFEYETNLAHLVYNEFNDANLIPDATIFARLLSPGPYGSMAKGLSAVQGHTLKPLPSIKGCLTKTKLSV
jgi:hypothetical protein